MSDLFQQVWDETLAAELENERSRGFSPEDFYTSGRASKANPNKEDPKWWAENGPKFVKSWEVWRDRSGLDIWTTPDGEPAIELEVRGYRGDLEILCYIDRVFTDGEHLYIVDLKSGTHSDPWPRQLALNNLGLLDAYGVQAKYGDFWSPRKGGLVNNWFDLRIYDADWMWEQVRVAREIRDQGLFAPQPNMLCKSACGVAAYCKAMSGPLFLEVMQPSHKG